MDSGTLYQIKVDELRIEPPFCDLFTVQPTTAKAVTASMKATGYDQAFPLVAWNGVVVDGHTRLRSAKAAGIHVVPVVYRQFASETEALEYAIACQRNRRNLTDAELVRCVAELGKRQRGGTGGTNPQDCGLPTPPSAADVADTLGISQRKVEQIRTIADHAPDEVRTALARGDLTVNAAYNATQEARRERPAAVETPAHLEPPALPDYGSLCCPFCGETNVVDDHNKQGNAYYVKCDSCGAQGPTGHSPQEAADAWNAADCRRADV